MAGATRAAIGVIVLAGGRGCRLGFVSKADLKVAGLRLLDGVVSEVFAVLGRTRIADLVISAPASVDLPRIDGLACGRRVLEDPPFGGPAAGMVAGLRSIATQHPQCSAVACLPVDAPHAARVLPALEKAFAESKIGVRAVTGTNKHHAVCLLRVRPFLAQIPDDVRNLALTRLFEGDGFLDVAVDAELMADIDTPADLAARKPESF